MPGLTPFQKKQYERIVEHLKDDKSANLQTVLLPASVNWAGGVEDQARLLQPPAAGSAMGVTGAMCLQYPLSRGSVHITSADVTEHPTVDPAFLAHPADAAVLAAGMKMLDKASKTQHLADKITKRVNPKPEVDVTDTKQLIGAVHDWTISEYHLIGSCAMGDCVDSRLKVKGARNLRVADASVFPNHVSGNIVASVYAVAEKAADLIKADWDHAALAKAA